MCRDQTDLNTDPPPRSQSALVSLEGTTALHSFECQQSEGSGEADLTNDMEMSKSRQTFIFLHESTGLHVNGAQPSQIGGYIGARYLGRRISAFISIEI